MSSTGNEPSFDTRGRILEAAEELFRVYGYAKTTVADMAKKLGMSPANVYRFFASKQALVEALARRRLEAFEAEALAIVNGTGSAEARFVALVDFLQASTRERYLSEGKVHELVAAAMARSWPAVAEHVRHMAEILGRLIAEGVARGEFPPQDVEVAARCVQGALIAFTHPQVMAECHAMGDTDMAPQARNMARFLLAALKAGFRPEYPASSSFAPS